MPSRFTENPTVIRVAQRVTWHEAPNNHSLPAGSYRAVPTLARDVVNGTDSPLRWTIDGPAGTVVMSAAEAYHRARAGELSIDGWTTENLTP